MGEVAAEVHSEIGKVFEYYEIVCAGQFADALKFCFVEAYPCGVVGVGVHNAADVVLGYYFFQLADECWTAVVVYIEACVA